MQDAQAEAEDWKKKFIDLDARFQRFLQDYDQLKEQCDRLEVINNDQVKEIQQKAWVIGQL